MKTTFHLAVKSEWFDQLKQIRYLPSQFTVDRFIHCTDGVERLMEVGNRYYKTSDEIFIALEIDLDSLEYDWRYDDEVEVYPHIYGAINRSSVVNTYEVKRSDDGNFVGLGDPVR